MFGVLIDIGAAALLVWAFAYVARRIYRSSHGKCSCGSGGGCSGCPKCGECSGHCEMNKK